MKGYLSLVLHTHLPYVKHPEDPNALEQRWLFEAITESYIPLLNVMERLVQDGVKFRITMSLTPPLLEMLRDPLMQQRYIEYLQKLVELVEKEVVRLANEPALRHTAEMYRWKLREALYKFTCEMNGDITTAFKRLARAGVLELMTSAATHAYLPLLRTREAVSAQIAMGVKAFEHHMGWRPRGIWLPECGYRPGIDEVLAENGLQYFIVDSHTLWYADPAPVAGVFAPVRTPSGLLAFARDKESAKQVWSSREGYPGDYVYREYYRDAGWDLDWDYIKPYVHPDGIRVNTGLKYYRITGQGPHKEPYVPEWGEERAADHAAHFLYARQQQAKELFEQHNQAPIIVSPYDTELFGHWWYEGPAFLNYVCRKAYYDQNEIALICPMDYPHIKAAIVTDMPESSWGNEGYSGVWLNSRNAWVYRHLHAAEERMAALAEAYPEPTDQQKRALNQAARELMLAQSSDWTFILNAGTTVTYANRRLNEHLGWFFALCDQLEKGSVDTAALHYLERLHGVFPYMDYQQYERPQAINLLSMYPSDALRVLMLSWEFPPVTVGGLGRHVYELSRALARKGVEVHVVTAGAPGLPDRQVVDRVCVHRTEPHAMPGDSFMDWVFQLNLQMCELARQLWMRRRFHLIHGHDWLVGEAARMMAARHNVPLLATIHATEHGRNNGIHNDIQRAIDRVEREFMNSAARVVVCSQAMRNEMQSVFGLPPEHVSVIHNGVDIGTLRNEPGTQVSITLPEQGKIIAFLGRFVKEKGVEILLEAAASLMHRGHDVHLVYGGRGPLQQELQHRARELGVMHRVHFPGFLADKERNALLAKASVAVFPSHYEPFGIVALEAMGAGTPVVVSDTGGLAEIVEHGVDGWKVRPGDLPGLVATIEHVLFDEAAARAAAERAKEKTKTKYTWDAVANDTYAVYQALVAQNEQRKTPVAVG